MVKKLFMDYIECFLLTPYVWGGTGPWGVDCSGLIIEGLKAVGLVRNDFDSTAQGLYNLFSQIHRGEVKFKVEEGCLLFFGKSTKAITHIALSKDERFMIEAGGGDSSVISDETAEAKNAFVRIRPIALRKDLVAIVLPFYAGKAA